MIATMKTTNKAEMMTKSVVLFNTKGGIPNGPVPLSLAIV